MLIKTSILNYDELRVIRGTRIVSRSGNGILEYKIKACDAESVTCNAKSIIKDCG